VRNTKIVNDDLSTLGGKPQGVFSSETVSCTSDDDDSVIKSDSAHDDINIFIAFFCLSMKIFWNYIFYFSDSTLSPSLFSCNSRSLQEIILPLRDSSSTQVKRKFMLLFLLWKQGGLDSMIAKTKCNSTFVFIFFQAKEMKISSEQN